MKVEDMPWFLGGKCKKPINKMPGAFSKYYLKAFESGEFIPENDYMEIFYETDKKYIMSLENDEDLKKNIDEKDSKIKEIKNSESEEKNEIECKKIDDTKNKK